MSYESSAFDNRIRRSGRVADRAVEDCEGAPEARRRPGGARRKAPSNAPRERQRQTAKVERLTTEYGEVAEWLTERSKTAKERRRHDGDPEGEAQSAE